jgi:polyisoprenoid-binding protein YceI
MMRKHVIALSLVTFFAASHVSLAKDYTIDRSHSNVGFSVKHFVSKVNGEFKEFDGELQFDPSKPEAAKIVAEVQAASVNTNEKKRDEHLASDDFFAAKKHPKFKFVSQSIKADGDKKYKVSGDLTLRGVTKPVVFDVEYLGETDDPWGNHRAGFTGTTTVNRKDFGINWNKSLDKGGFVLGEDVVINLNLEAIEKKAEEKSAPPAKKQKTK